MNVSAKDTATNKAQSMTITGGSSLPKDDIERMMRDAQDHADEDRQRKEEAETRNLGETWVYQTEKLLAESGEQIPADKKGEIESSLSELKTALGGSDLDKIKTTTEALIKVSQEAGAAMYAAQQTDEDGAAGAAGAAGASGTDTGNAGKADNGDDVVDAEIVDEDDKK